MRPNSGAIRDRHLPEPLKTRSSTYVFERRIGTHGQRFRAHLAGRQRRPFLVHVLPRNGVSANQIAVLRALTDGDPNLPQIQDTFERDGSLYIVLPWVPGRVLREYLDEGHRNADSPRRLSAVEAVRLFNGFVHLLRRFNHRCNIIHGDLKPENLTVARNPNRLLMIDFGSAWVVERTTQHRATDGIDFHYAAPELIQPDNTNGFHADFRSDQFSASVIFYEMLTFERPYGGVGGMAGLPDYRNLYGCSLVPASELSPDRHRLTPKIWKAIDAAVMTGLNLDPKNRFQNFDAWLNALKAIRIESERATELSAASKAAMWLANALKPFDRRKR
jgi:serine/threonine protein kinase